MKAFIFDLVNKLQRTSNTLDAKAILCNKTWRVFSDTGEKEVYIFMEDGKLVISVNGNVDMGTWMYVPANQSLVITGKQNYLVHPVICNNILALVVDGTNQCAFLLDDTKRELEAVKSLQNISTYITSNMGVKAQYLPKSMEAPNTSTSFLFGESGKFTDGELHLDIRQIKRKEGRGQKAICYSPYADFGLLPEYGSVWAFSPDYKGDFDTCTFIFIFDYKGVLKHIHYHSVLPNGKWRCWLSVAWDERDFYIRKKDKYKRYNIYYIPDRGDGINDIVDETYWMNQFADYLKADVKKYQKIFIDVFGVDPVAFPFWEWE
jgi:hypothetical protein